MNGKGFGLSFMLYTVHIDSFKSFQTNLHGFETLADCFGVCLTSVEIQNCLLSVGESSRDIADITPELQGQIQELEQPSFPLLSLGMGLIPHLRKAGHSLLNC